MENVITVVQEINQNRFGSDDVQHHCGLTLKTMDEYWTQSRSKANIFHRWQVDGMLIRKQATNVENQLIQTGALLGKDGINLPSRSGDERFCWQENSTPSTSSADVICERGDK